MCTERTKFNIVWGGGEEGRSQLDSYRVKYSIPRLLTCIVYLKKELLISFLLSRVRVSFMFYFLSLLLLLFFFFLGGGGGGLGGSVLFFGR